MQKCILKTFLEPTRQKKMIGKLVSWTSKAQFIDVMNQTVADELVKVFATS